MVTAAAGSCLTGVAWPHSTAATAAAETLSGDAERSTSCCNSNYCSTTAATAAAAAGAAAGDAYRLLMLMLVDCDGDYSRSKTTPSCFRY